MNIAILNGNPNAENADFDTRVSKIAEGLEVAGGRVTTHLLRDRDVRMCKGCFGCWHRTPGECVHRDDTPLILKTVINADFVLLASPVSIGFVSPLLKTAIDKFLPLIHPYVFIKNNEMRHLRRYPRYPDWGVLLEKSGDTDDDDIAIITECMRRGTLNFHSSLRFSKLVTEPSEEVVHAIVRA